MFNFLCFNIPVDYERGHTMKHNLAIKAIYAEIGRQRIEIQDLQDEIQNMQPGDRRDRYQSKMKQRREMVKEMEASIEVLKGDK